MSRQPIRPTNRRARGTSPRDHLLDVKIRTSTARRQRNEKMGRWIFNTILLVSIVAATVFGLRTALDKFFFNNADYTLRHITLDLDNILTHDEALQQTGLHEGVNIFSIDLATVETRLKAIPQVLTVHIERELPDHLTVTLTARQPIAWIAAPGETGDVTASEQSLMTDSTGFLLRPRHIQPEYFDLPVIYGINTQNIRDGEPLENENLHELLTLLDAVSRHPESLLRIRTLDVSKGYCIEVVNDRQAHIIFAPMNFEDQLARLQQLLTYCETNKRPLESVNLMVKRNTPVTFIASASPVESTKISPTTGAARTRRN